MDDGSFTFDLSRERLQALIGGLWPGAEVTGFRLLGVDAGPSDEDTLKGAGYGTAVLVEVADGAASRRCVFHVGKPDQFGHDRRADRAGNALLAFDTFSAIPRHVRALDAGALDADGGMISLRNGGEFYLLTEFAPGEIYAAGLRAIAARGNLEAGDRERCQALAAYLAKLHAGKIARPQAYRRAIRDLVGSGEGVFGLADSYEQDAPGAPLARISRIEAACAAWRWKLRGREDRLARTHGDFHPFNILFDESGELHLLDASRGCLGDPADDAVCLAINYLFFGLEHPGRPRQAFRELWEIFWEAYLRLTGDREVLEIAPPFFAWRALVLASPAWYPNTAPEGRDALLGYAERSLAAGYIDLEAAGALFQ